MNGLLHAFAASFHSEEVPASFQLMITCVSKTNGYPWLINQNAGDDSPTSTYYSKACDMYEPSVQTSLNCFLNYSNEGSLNESLAQYAHYCRKYAYSTFTGAEYYSIWQNGTKFLQNADETYDNATLNFPIVLPDAALRSSLQQFHYGYYNFVAAFNFSILINALVIAFVIFMFISHKFHLNDKVTRYVRAKLIMPCVFGVSHHAESNIVPGYRVILPTRGEAIILGIFILVNISLATYNYPLFSTSSETKYYFFLRCVANRMGGLSFGLIPLLILLAGRNSFIQHFTRMPYSSMIFFHKWVARAMTIYGMLHGGLWTLYVFTDKSLSLFYYFTNYAYWRWGVCILLTSVFLIVHSVYALKSSMYEVFLATHIIFAGIFIIGCLRHCAEFGWLGWIYLAALCWVGDRVIRLWRVFFLFGGYRNAYASIISQDDKIFRISISCVDFSKFRFFPGCYAYLYIHNKKWFWQSHPFTLMKSGNGIDITIKAKQGLTMELFNSLPKDCTAIPIRMALEGPYGHEAPVESYSEVILLTSGTGIPGPISYLEKVINIPSKIKVLHFYWIVPHEKYVAIAQEKLMSLFSASIEPLHTSFSIHIYVTRPQNTSLIEHLPSEVKLHYEKPNVKLVIEHCVENAGGSVAVVSCANPRLDDFIRCTTAGAVLKTKYRVDYYDELQVW